MRMKMSGVPDVSINKILKLKQKRENNGKIANFVIGDKNIVVIGKDQYLWSIKLMRLSMAHNLKHQHQFISASMLNMNININDIIFDNDIICIHSIVNSDRNKIPGAVDSCIFAGKKILLSSSSLDDIQNTFSENWESIDNNFEVMKV
jgi:hypothetical protein